MMKKETYLLGLSLMCGMNKSAAPATQPSLSTQDYANFIRQWEQNKPHPKAYTDSEGNRTVGPGFNLDREGARQTFQRRLPNANYNKVYHGRSTLSQDQLNRLMMPDVRNSMQTAQQFAPNFKNLPTKVKKILTDMSYNLGREGINDFSRLQKAIQNKNWHNSAIEMKDSDWYSQTGRRAKHHVNYMKQLAGNGSTSAVPSGNSGPTGNTPANTYTIQSGDTLSSISKQHYGSPKYYQRIADQNNISNPNKIQAGDKLDLPNIDD